MQTTDPYETSENNPFLCFHHGEGKALILASAALLFAEHVKTGREESITAHFVTHTVELRGSGLSAIFYALHTARLHTVRCGTNGTAAGTSTIIRSITASQETSREHSVKHTTP